jgi:hypothetical protein
VEGNQPSRKDVALGVVFSFSGLLAFALSFTLSDADGRPILFAACIALCIVCLIFATNKTGVLLGFAAFILVRLAWALAVTH